jgi:putative FmdB family regulatory protein
MPLYEYECDICGNNFDITKSMSESSTEELCEVCGSKLRRVFANAGAIGTRDTFGINNAFIGNNGQVIDTWKKWERAGYKDQMTSPRVTAGMKARFKEKLDQEKVRTKKKFTVGVKQ